MGTIIYIKKFDINHSSRIRFVDIIIVSKDIFLCGLSLYYEEGWRYMIEHSIKTNTKKVKVENIKVVYNLIFENALYSLECIADGSEIENNYCYIENFTDDEGEAESFLRQMVKGKVLPIHLKEIAEDNFGN